MLLDTASLYFRAYYGVPDSVRSPSGVPTNAVRGLLDMLARLITGQRPAMVVPCWDDDWRPDFRVALLPSYKAHRVATGEESAAAGAAEDVPDPLAVQVPVIRALLAAFGLPPVGAPGFEADDVIASYADQSRMPVDIVSGDRDLFQLVRANPPVRVFYPAGGMSKLAVVDPAYVRAKYGVSPQQYADFAALRGDASDGLPGVKGVGEKTAARLLADFVDLDGVLAAAADPDATLTARVRAALLDSADYLDRARKVVATVRDVPVPAPPLLPRVPADPGTVAELAAQYGIQSSVTRLTGALAAQTSEE